MLSQFARDIEAKDDLFHGQIVIIVARWFLILAGVGMTLWTAPDVGSLTLPIGGLSVLMALNCYFHGRYLVKQPANSLLVRLTSGLDLALVLLIVAVWSQGHGIGLSSPYFVFLYPTLLAIALVFPPRITLGYAVAVVASYLAIVVLTSDLAGIDEQKALVQRVITLVATAGLGTYFWRIQRRGRQAIRSVGRTEQPDLERLFAGAASNRS